MASVYTSDTVYSGNETLVVAMDLGTTHTGASFTYLYPGEKPKVHLVTLWPGQPEASGAAKIPTFVAYRGTTAVTCGQEADEYLEDDEYVVARWFKLHLHPESMKQADEPPRYGSSSNFSSRLEIPPLPRGVTIQTVYVDFMKYLFSHTKTYFEQRMTNGESIWRRLRDRMEIVLATPNGWDITQQTFLRRAAIVAGLVTDANADTLLKFVTEGEASVHYVMAYSPTRSWLSKGSTFLVIDAGGSTVDSTLYECKAVEPHVELQEVCASECVQAGGVFVDRAAKRMLEDKLRASKFNDPESIRDMVKAFEAKTKRLFDGNQTSNIVQFGGNKDTDKDFSILKGKLTLTKNEVAQCFDGAIAAIVESCQRLLQTHRVEHILLVGGFGESPYLRRRLDETFAKQNIRVVTVEQPSRKAAAEGSTIWYIKRQVKARAARFTLGTISSTAVHRAEHLERISKAFVDSDGLLTVRNTFTTLVKKDQVLDDDYTHTASFATVFSPVEMLFIPDSVTRKMDLYAWESSEAPPFWAKDEDGEELVPGLRLLCSLEARVTRMKESMKEMTGPQGKKYFQSDLRVLIFLGGTEMKARLEWTEGDETCEGPVSIIPNSTI
ncbi:SubName: Full=Uncharacterized protein {ECO:0000313/EMBL:CCA74286.1} [Serendipita indica DSM 11827]|uniref:Hsp70 protein n=1 Tax=Serendipita indica (strain DSM 11827) TaxID=1109443 RepID=G4TSJ3_SERID|nr:SubName: Full=Uncharacterized protein {ECO:0000313/EMBL:CCA74286.1} [Serendipita indica DSM 11827]CCA74286.1 hypothetical protein PIIN_08239 [Serendipita indica DSM 11827]